MAKFWDISPPRKKTNHITPTEKKRRKSNVSWLFFLTLIGAFFIVFAGAANLPEISTPTNSAVPSIAPSSKLSKTNLNIKLINGTGLFEEKDKVTTLLSTNGYKINLSENALNTYPETIIYYKSSAESYAKNLEVILKDYHPKIMKLSQETTYDLIIVIGKM